MNLFGKNNQNNLVYIVTLLVIITGFLMSLVFGDFGHVIILLGFLIIYIVLTHLKLMPNLFSLLFLLSIILMVLGSGSLFDLYRKYLWYDKVVHYTAEFVLTLLAGYLFMASDLVKTKNQFTFFVIVVSIGITLGAVWEIIEWIMNFFVPPKFDYTAVDTATDLVIDAIGAISAGTVSLRWVKNKLSYS